MLYSFSNEIGINSILLLIETILSNVTLFLILDECSPLFHCINVVLVTSEV